MRNRKHGTARKSQPAYRAKPRFHGADRRKKRTVTLTSIIGAMIVIAYIGSAYTNKAPEPKSKYSKAATAQQVAQPATGKNQSK
jgi:hypothetical protein